MARILAISSFVAHGHVGLSASVPALQRLGHDVIALPAVVLSNHPGHTHAAGTEIEPERLKAMLDALESNGFLKGIQAVLTGYLPSIEHVRFAAEATSRVSHHNPSATIYSDPILGDDPDGLYLPEETATAIRDELLPLADMVFPNRFELEWLTGHRVTSVHTAFAAAMDLRSRSVLATSVPGAHDDLVNLWVTDGEAILCPVPRQSSVPHGTGDLLAALFIGHRLNGGIGREHLGRAVAGVAATVAASNGHADLQIAAAQDQWSNAEPLPIFAL